MFGNASQRNFKILISILVLMSNYLKESFIYAEIYQMRIKMANLSLLELLHKN